MNDTDRAYSIEDLLFLKRCDDKFFKVNPKSVLSTQKRAT